MPIRREVDELLLNGLPVGQVSAVAKLARCRSAIESLQRCSHLRLQAVALFKGCEQLASQPSKLLLDRLPVVLGFL